MQLKQKGRCKVTYALGSGAGTTIGPPDIILGVKLCRTKYMGTPFRIADGAAIPNLGEVQQEGTASNGSPIEIKAQRADVTKPLAARTEIVDAPNFVIISK